jgi:hypothetical protein
MYLPGKMWRLRRWQSIEEEANTNNRNNDWER